MPIKFPTFKVRGQPTPNEKLVVCDECGKAEWVNHGPAVYECYNANHHANGGYRRMREATPKEYEQGKAAITTVIG